MENNCLNNYKNPSKCFRRVFCLCLFVLPNLFFAQPIIKWQDAKKNFGFVKKGSVVKIEFSFTNIGNEPLLISDAKAECSCTTVEFPKQPIAPHTKASILILFDTKSVYDRQDRIVEITSNAKKSPQKIRFKGVVLK